MKEIITISMDLKSSMEGLELAFESGISGVVMDKLNEEDVKNIKKSIKSIADTIEKAIVKDMEEFIEEKMEKRKEEKEKKTEEKLSFKDIMKMSHEEKLKEMKKQVKNDELLSDDERDFMEALLDILMK